MTYASTGQKTPKGLDDGFSTTKSKKRKRGPDFENLSEARPQPSSTLTEVPKILPGERMGDYSARVDQALPVAGLVNKGKRKDIVGERQQSRMEKRMQKMQKEWREEEARRKARLEEQKEEEDEGEDGVELNDVSDAKSGKSKKKGKRRKKNHDVGGQMEDEDEDPWAIVAANRKREQEEKEKEGKGKGLVGLHDVVLAPPKFDKVPKVKVGVGDVVKKGGLKKQVEMGEARRSVIEGYRQMMRAKREQQVAA